MSAEEYLQRRLPELAELIASDPRPGIFVVVCTPDGKLKASAVLVGGERTLQEARADAVAQLAEMVPHDG